MLIDKEELDDITYSIARMFSFVIKGIAIGVGIGIGVPVTLAILKSLGVQF